MAQQKVSDTLFEALDIIINKRIEAVQKDKTILCVVEDNSKAEEGEYIVSNASAKFTAYSENTAYRNGQNVWVLIPEGNYNNEKKIIGKHMGDSSTPYVWVDPMDTYAKMTDDVLTDMVGKQEIGLIANCSAPINLQTREPVGDDRKPGPGHNETFKVNISSVTNAPITLTGLDGYTRMGIQADFRTAFGSLNPITGSYGLIFIVKTKKTIIDGDDEKAVELYVPVVFDSTDMWGNPYGYNTAFTQSICFDINQEEYGVPIALVGYFYQNYDFANADGMLDYYYTTSTTNSQGNIVPEYTLIEPNIFVNNIQVSFGYSMDEVDTDTIYLFTPNSTGYLVNDKTYTKTLKTRFIYVGDDGTRFAINDETSFNNRKEEMAAFAALNSSIHWYRYVREEGTKDDYAGDFWKEIPNTQNAFSIEINDLKDLEDERFKCMLFYEPDNNGNVPKKWAAANRYIHSNELVFVNENNPYDAARDLERALRLSPIGEPNGVFNLYKASYSANNSLDNSSDADLPREIEATFWTFIDKAHKMKDVTRLAWYIPKKNTMITAPSEGRGYDSSTQWLLATLEEVNAKATDVSAEELALFKERINDYYIIVNYDVKAQNSDSIVLTYYIEPTLIKHWTNNTIYASAYYHQKVYEGINASVELVFGSKGSNGTDYTLLLKRASEQVGPEENGKILKNPPAWTFITDNNDQNTTAMTLTAALYDADDKEVPDVQYTWRKKGSPAITGTGASITITRPSGGQGIIYECIAERQKDATASSPWVTQFVGYLIVPERRSRDYIAMDGADVVSYDSTGVNPQYYKGAYGLFDNTGKKEYTNNVTIYHTYISDDHTSEDKYLPQIEQRSNGYYALKPTGMFFHDANGKDTLYNNIYIIINKDGTDVWFNPLLVVVDPYGNRFLDGWNGELTIDEENNSIMASVMGAGKKDAENKFTGLLLGDLPKVKGANHTGLLGYESGEETYGIFDDGSMFLGKSSRAQLRLSGTEGVIENAGYSLGTGGIKIDFDGALIETKATLPYIDLKASTGAQVYLGTGGQPTPNLYFSIKSPNSANGGNNKELIHIGKQQYYLQTDDYPSTSETVNGTTVTTPSGLKIDLKNGTFDSKGPLTISGNSVNINATGGALNLTGANFKLLAGQLEDTNTTYNSRKVFKSVAPTSENGNASLVYLSDRTSNANNITGVNNAYIKVGDTMRQDWKMVIGENFGVDKYGTLYATNGNLTGKITANEGTIGGFNIATTAKTEANGGHFMTNSLYAQKTGVSIDNGSYDYEVGMQPTAGGGDLAFYVKRKNAGQPWTTSASGHSDLFYVKGNGTLYAANANITGTINANAGNIGGMEIVDGELTVDAAHIETLYASKIGDFNSKVKSIVAETVTADYISGKSAVLGKMSIGSNGIVNLSGGMWISGTLTAKNADITDNFYLHNGGNTCRCYIQSGTKVYIHDSDGNLTSSYINMPSYVAWSLYSG